MVANFTYFTIYIYIYIVLKVYMFCPKILLFSFFLKKIAKIIDAQRSTGCLKIEATHQYDNDLLLRQETPCHLVWVYAWSGFCMVSVEDPSFKILCNGACERPSSWECLWRDLFGLLIKISHRRTSCYQLPARFGIFFHLVEDVYWPCGLKLVYLTIKFGDNC